MKVKNLNGTSDNTCDKCGTWLNHWENLSGEVAILCSCKDCDGFAEVGAHVQKNTSDCSWYIVPLCKECNKKPSTDVFELKEDTVLVSARKCR